MKNCNIITVNKVHRHNKFVSNYLKEQKKNWLSSDEQKMIKNTLGYSVTNEMRSKVEVYEFKKSKPKEYILYVDAAKKIATTWTGEFLGRVIFGTYYRSNFGDERICIDVIGVNNINYHGVFFKSAGDYAIIKSYKK